MQLLADMAATHDIAVDVPHHTSKGEADPGNANRGRGASSMKDAARLVYTLSPMTANEAATYGLTESDRRPLVRMDSAKVNIAPPMADAKWFRLVGVRLGNGNEIYPHGDEVQTIETWSPPDMWKGLSTVTLNAILDEIDQGLPGARLYSNQGGAIERAAWRVVTKHVDRTEAQAREMIKTWLKNGVLKTVDYHDDEDRKDRKGLRVEPTKRPG
jgi:hypothetical protein